MHRLRSAQETQAATKTLLWLEFSPTTMRKQKEKYKTHCLMKKIYFLTLLSILTLLSCEEQERVIVPFVPSGNRVILLEEFTGVGCTNCPKGSREIASLLTQFPDNLVAVSIHAGFFADTSIFNFGQYDFRTEEGEFLYGYLGPNEGYPAGVVNRTPRSGHMQIGLQEWASAINNDIQIPPAIEIAITRTYDPGTRQLNVTIDGIGKESITADLRLSIMLTESGIVDAQDDKEATPHIVLNYVHNHVLRDMLTPAAGESFATSIATGEKFSKSYTTTLNDQWVPENMEIVAFISAVNGNSFPVVQAAQIHLTE